MSELVIVLDAGEWQTRCPACAWKSARFETLPEARTAFEQHQRTHAGEAA